MSSEKSFTFRFVEVSTFFPSLMQLPSRVYIIIRVVDPWVAYLDNVCLFLFSLLGKRNVRKKKDQSQFLYTFKISLSIKCKFLKHVAHEVVLYEKTTGIFFPICHRAMEVKLLGEASSSLGSMH